MSAQTQQTGLAAITNLIVAHLPLWLQWGTGSGATSSATNVTTTSTTEARVSAALSQATVTSSDDTLQATGTITAAGTRTITEVGLFDAAGSGSPPSGGNMDFYASFGAVNLNEGDSIAFTVKVTFS